MCAIYIYICKRPWLTKLFSLLILYIFWLFLWFRYQAVAYIEAAAYIYQDGKVYMFFKLMITLILCFRTICTLQYMYIYIYIFRNFSESVNTMISNWVFIFLSSSRFGWPFVLWLTSGFCPFRSLSRSIIFKTLQVLTFK